MSLAGETDDVELPRRADAALCEAKRRGRNRYYCDGPHTQEGPLVQIHDGPDALID